MYGRTRDRFVDCSTVSLALHLSVEVALVVEATTGREPLCEIRKGLPHHHPVCPACGEERTVSDVSVQAMADEVFQDHRFRVVTDHFMLFGHCVRYQGLAPGREGESASAR